MVKCLPAMRETQVQSLGQEDPLEKEMAAHSSTLAWKIPWMEEPGRLQSMGSQSQTRLSNFTSVGGRTEEGSGWEARVYLWQIHFDIWQNQYNIVNLKNKINCKKKKKKRNHKTKGKQC